MKNKSTKIALALLLVVMLSANIFILISSRRSDIPTAPVSPSDSVSVDNTEEISISDISVPTVTPTDIVSDVKSESDAEPEVVDLNQYATVIVKSAAMRTSNSQKSELVRYISKGKKVIVLESKKSWHKVEYDGKKGWVHADCLELIRNHALEATIYKPIPPQVSGKVQSLSGTATEKYIKQIASENKVAGLTIAVIKNGEVAYNYEYGYANVEDKQKVTVNTKFRIASLSKVFTAMMAVKLAQDGQLDLDKHIGDILKLKAENPKYKNDPITTRMLLTHTSSFNDKSTIFSAYLKKDLENKESYSSFKPGSRYTYSNFGIGVAGAVIEKSSGMLLTDYAQSAFFKSMGIDAGFDGSKLTDKKDVADCMIRDKIEQPAENLIKARESQEIGLNFSFAAGGLLISAVDMARVTSILVNDGVYNGKRYLSSKTLEEFHTPHINTSKFSQCIGIRKSDNVLPDRTMYYHTGASFGVFSLLAYDLEDKSGVVILSTGSLDYSDDNGIRRICSDIMNLIYEDILN